MRFRHFGQCPFCNMIEGPYDTAADIAEIMKSQHRNCGPTEVTEIAGRKITTPAKPVRAYTRGDVSRPFGSGFDDTCYECGFGYMMGEFICMVTLQDGERGKAMHKNCANDVRKRIDAEQYADQPDAPPF